jgi:DNA-binding MarR family transcriptional regulator
MPTTTSTTDFATELEAALTELWSSLLRRNDGDLSRTSASVLAMLDVRPRRVSELAEAQSVAQPTMTVALQRLEARGLVTRERDAHDRRATNVVITDEGRATLARRRAARAAVLEERIAALDPSARAALAAALPVLHDLADPSPSDRP